jgi:hypothetical protein
MEEKTQNVSGTCCVNNKTPFLVGLLGFLIIGWVFLAVVDKLGLGIATVFSKRSITVSGSANRQETNKLASFNATVSSKNADKAAVMSEVTQKSEKLIADLKAFGVDDKDLKTQSLNIYREQTPYWDNGIQKYQDGDWNGSISVDITLRDISKSGELTTLLAAADTSNIWGPNYSLNEGEPEKAALLKQAFDSAKVKADSLAGGMGLKVGKVLSVVEGSTTNAIYPMRDSAMGAGGGGMEPGSSNVSTSLTVTFELR